MTQHILSILIEDDDLPTSDEEMDEFMELFEEFWDKAREFNRNNRCIKVTRFRSGGLRG